MDKLRQEVGSAVRRLSAWIAASPRRNAYAALAIVAALTVWFAVIIFKGLPDDEAVRGLANGTPGTRLLDIHGEEIGRIVREQRIDVPLAQVSPHVIKAVLAIEDQRFLEHPGVDVVRIGGAFLKNLRVGRVAEGGSTITQQLARQSFLTSERKFTRKVREALVATRIERQFSKEQILEFYLNKVYFGDGLYGIETAALGYFGKRASELDVSEAALLAGLLKFPSSCAPTADLECAVERRNVVLGAMREMDAIDESTEAAAKAAPVHLQDERPRDQPFAEYFKAEVRRHLVEQLGHERVYQENLVVHTTLDAELQRAAEREVQETVRDIEGRTDGHRARRDTEPDDPLQAALVAVDVDSGEVRAMVGGRNFAQSRYNRATLARRQPGSAFKPFVYAAAIERGFTPATRIENLQTGVRTIDGAWTPDDRGASIDSMTVRTALRTSSNRAAVRTLEDVGIPETMRYIERFGFPSVPGVPSIALGTGEVTLLSLTSAFATFGNAGQRVAPAVISRVETLDGELLYEHRPQPQPVVSKATAFLMTSLLADVVTSGTASQARALGLRQPAAGKTGTTNDYHDAWFVGYTPSLATGVWIGYDQPRTIMERGYGGSLAVPLWARFMMAATRGAEPAAFAVPSSVRPVSICRISGRLPTDLCVRDATVATEYFVAGSEPTAHCHAHAEPLFPELLFEDLDTLPTYVPGAMGTTGMEPSPDSPALPPRVPEQPPQPVEIVLTPPPPG